MWWCGETLQICNQKSSTRYTASKIIDLSQNQKQSQLISRIINDPLGSPKSKTLKCCQNQQLIMPLESTSTSPCPQNQHQPYHVPRININLTMSPESTSTSPCPQNQHQPHHVPWININLTMFPDSTININLIRFIESTSTSSGF